MHATETPFLAEVVLCEGSWCRLAIQPGHTSRIKNIAQSKGFGTGPDRIEFRIANCLGLCGKGANARINVRGSSATAEPLFLRNVHELKDSDWLRIFQAIRNGTPVYSVLAEHFHTSAKPGPLSTEAAIPGLPSPP